MKTNYAGYLSLTLIFLAGCGAGSVRDASAIDPPKLDGGRMGLSPEERIEKIKASNMSEKDKADRIAKISGSAPK